MTMVSMKMSPKEAQAETCCAPEAGEGPEYPYGLRLELDDDALAKLGINVLPSVGSPVIIQARATIVSTSSDTTQDGKQRQRASVQITDMDMQVGDGKSPAQQLYANSNMNP